MMILDARNADALGGGPSFSSRNRLIRLLWQLCWRALASWTPRQAAPWRRWLLRRFGASMASGTDVRGSARIWLPSNLVMGTDAVIGPHVDCYNQALITLGERALVSQHASLCAGTHDVDDPHFQLVARPIVIGAGAWIAAEAFIGPGARMGANAVLGARGVAFGQLAADMIYAGNPAMPLRRRGSAVMDDEPSP